jgi:anthranilate synthase component 2
VNKILLLDNYDSFTYNLVQIVEEIVGSQIDVRRNNEIELGDVAGYDKIILSPGPGIPEEAGILLPLIKAYAASKSIFGVCLGHQAIGQVFGGKLTNLTQVFHGIKSEIKLSANIQQSIYQHDWFLHLPSTIDVGRYHSWVIDATTVPDELEVTAYDHAGMIMAIRHKDFDVQGVQFHPESVLTPMGKTMIENWLK